jgi:uncharacterized membrane protein YedE/YeeE
VPTTSIVSKLRRPATPLLVISALFVAAGGVVHLREWLDIYRHVPASLPGADVVRVGFVLNAGASAVLALALFAAVVAGRRVVALVVAAAVFEAASLATLIQTRRGTVFGWMEAGWSRGATQTRAVEIGALVALTATAAIIVMARRSDTEPATETAKVLAGGVAVPTS